MKILIVASLNKGSFVPFVVEQAVALKKQGCDVNFFGLQGKGFKGYFGNLPRLKREIKAFRPDVIHAHYGLSGLFANLQRRVPVVTTYHGSDINEKKLLPLSKMAMRLSAWNIFVSQKTIDIAKPRKKYSLLPCGIDFSELQLTEKSEARRRMKLDDNKRYILFAGAFDNEIKNALLAQKAVEEMHDADAELLELKGYSRDEVTLLMCASDAFLMTSITEGSPQVIKEALACGCPIVSVDVGDVKDRVAGIAGCFVASSRELTELVALLQKAVSFEGRILGKEKLLADGLENRQVAEKLMDVYERTALLS